MSKSKLLGRKIANARKKVNFSQKELAQQLVINPLILAQWERNESRPDQSTLIKLSKILQVDLHYFLEEFQTKSLESKIIEFFVDLAQSGEKKRS